MFRKMRRFKQELDEKECIDILKNEKRGVLSVIGDDGYPYGIPMNHWYNEEDGKLYFHGAGEGHKIDSVKRCGKASYCVMDKGFKKDGEWALNIKSVIIFGKTEIVKDKEKNKKICRELCLKFTNDFDYINNEIEKYGEKVVCLELTPEHMTGKAVKES